MSRASREDQGKLRVAFVSTSVSPYCVVPRRRIDQDGRIVTRHIFARYLEPGRQWFVDDLTDTFEVASGFTVQGRDRFLYIPTGLPGALRRFRPDVIVSEQLGTLLLFTLMYALPRGIPVILRWEGTPYTECRFAGRARRLFRRLLASRVAGFLCYSSGSERYLRSLGLKQPARRIPYSVDDTLFHPPQPVDGRNPRVFLFVGQIVERKGLHLLLPAYYQVARSFPDAELWVVGDGEQRESLQATVPAEYRNNIRWFGFLPAVKIAGLMRQAGSLVCPTLEDHGPVVQIEAARTGLPIISTPYSGNAELVVEDRVNGFIVDARDTGQLAAAMIRLLEHCDRRSLYNRTLEMAAIHSPEHEARITIDAVLEIVPAEVGS